MTRRKQVNCRDWKKLFFSAMVMMLMLAFILLSGCNAPGKDGESLAGDRSLQDVKDRGKLIAGTSTSYPPMEFYDESGMLIGFDMDVAKVIASELEVDLQLVDYEWSDLFTAINNGSVDIAISSMTITPERQREILFSAPYFNGGQVIMTLKGNAVIKSPQDLPLHRVGAQEGTTCEQGALLYVPSDQLVLFKDNLDELAALMNHSLDALILDYVNAAHRLKSDSSLRIVGEPFTQEYYGIATRLGNDALMNEVNGVLREMKRNGKLVEIKDKWLK